jgi:hypothetical protein
MTLLLLTLFFLSFYGSPAVSKPSLRAFTYFVICVFWVEVCVKFWAFGARVFIARAANIIDAVTVGAAFFSILVYAFSPDHSNMRQSPQVRARVCWSMSRGPDVPVFIYCPYALFTSTSEHVKHLLETHLSPPPSLRYPTHPDGGHPRAVPGAARGSALPQVRDLRALHLRLQGACVCVCLRLYSSS